MTSNVTDVRQRLVERIDEVLALYPSLDVARMSLAHRNLLADLIEALDRLAEGRYGVCVGCGDRLGSGRLLEEPTAAMCDNCALEDRWRPFGPR